MMLQTALDANKQPISEIPVAEQKRAVRILAKSIYRELRSQGYDEKQIVSLATELLGEVAKKMARPATHS